MDSKDDSNPTKKQKLDDLANIRALLNHKGQYHDHKETLAHASIVIQLGILAFVLKMDYLQQSERWDKQLHFVGYILLWAIVSGYMAWQLNNRRQASEQTNELIEVIEKKTTDKNCCQAIRHAKGRNDGPMLGECFLWTVDFLILTIGVWKIAFY